MSPIATSAFVAIAFALLVGFDIYLAVDGVDGNTYSERIRRWNEKWVITAYLMALGLGLLLGHWFL